MKPSDHLAEFRADPNNSTRARLTDAERADYDMLHGSGPTAQYTRDEALEAINRPDLIPPPLPALAAKGAYHPEDLKRYLERALHRGMKDDAIARALKVPVDRIHYFQTPDGKRGLERRIALLADLPAPVTADA